MLKYIVFQTFFWEFCLYFKTYVNETSLNWPDFTMMTLQNLLSSKLDKIQKV